MCRFSLACLAALHTAFLGLNAELMGEYIEYVADSLLAYLNVPPYYKTLNPVGHIFGLFRSGHWLMASSVLVHGRPPYARKVELFRTCGVGVQWHDRRIIGTAATSQRALLAAALRDESAS